MDSSSSDKVCRRHHASQRKVRIRPTRFQMLGRGQSEVRLPVFQEVEQQNNFLKHLSEPVELGLPRIHWPVLASLERLNFSPGLRKSACAAKPSRTSCKWLEKASEGRVRGVVIAPLGHEGGAEVSDDQSPRSTC